MPSVTATAQFKVTGQAKIALSVTNISSPVNVGQAATATLSVSNSGSVSASVTITGVTDLGTTQEGTWISKTVSVPAGQTVSVQMQTSSTMVAQFAGQTLTANFKAAW